MTVVRKKKGSIEGLVINQINIRSADRSRKDIGSWRSAHINAESVLNPNRTALYNVYEEILLDGHLSGIIEKRISAVVNKTLRFKNKDTEVEGMEGLIKSTKFRNIIKTGILTELWGNSGIEFIPGAEFDYNLIPRKHIKQKWKIISYEQNGQEGISYEGVNNIWILGDESNLGLLLKCAPYAIYKKGNTADWAQYIEIFGQPVRIIKYDAYDGQTKAELKEVLDESGSSLALMIPKQADFDMKDGKQSNGDGKLQATFMEKLNDEMSILVLGNTETTANNKGGSNAKSETQREEQLEITKSDLINVENLLNTPQFISILKSYGYPVEGGRFEFDKDVNLDEVEQKVKIIGAVKGLGAPVDDDYIYEVTGIPKPKDYEKLKQQKEAEKEAEKETFKPSLNDNKTAVKKNEPKNLKDNLVNRFRLMIADFFDPAP
jgi:hypothetical protein